MYQLKPLYVLKFRPSKWEPRRQLTELERYQGWYDDQYGGDGRQPLRVWHNDGSSEEVVQNEGHELGSLHTRRASHVLSWEVSAGDMVEAVIPVEFTDSGAYYTAEVSRSIPLAIWKVECLSVLGRLVALGEDDADEAFGHDQLRAQVEAAVDGDWRKSLCELRLTPWAEDNIPPRVEIRRETPEKLARDAVYTRVLGTTLISAELAESVAAFCENHDITDLATVDELLGLLRAADEQGTECGKRVSRESAES